MASATRPHLSFPPLSTQTDASSSKQHCEGGGTMQTPRLHIRTPTGGSGGSTEAQRCTSRPLTLAASPPASPTSTVPSTTTFMDSDEKRPVADGSMTPPLTPVNPTHSQSDSASSFQLSPGAASRTRSNSGESISTELKIFPFHFIDYDSSSKKLLGSGLWSDVFLVQPRASPPRCTGGGSVEATPPLTPDGTPKKPVLATSAMPHAFAIKVPASRSAKAVLQAEATILSYISRCPNASHYTIPFYGLDPRNNALVLHPMDTTLEFWVQTTLNPLPEPGRTTTLGRTFPGLAHHLLTGLSWLHTHGTTHADIKPANILLSLATPTHALFSDFSSATLSHDPSSPPPLGAGTWDFLHPDLLTSAPPAPSSATDLWALAMTLLYVVLGGSPFDAVANAYLRRDCIKKGRPMEWARTQERSIARMKALGDELGMDLEAWFGRVLGQGVVEVPLWKAELEAAGRKGRREGGT